MSKTSAEKCLPKVKVVIDTNVLISSMISAGPSREIIRGWLDNQFELITSERMLREFILSSRKLRLSKFIDQSDAVLVATKIKTMGRFVNTRCLPKICRDADDDKILACALAGKADFLITGDEDILTLSSSLLKKIRIVTPRNFLSVLKNLD